MRQAQNEAIQRRLNRTIEFRTNSGQIQYGIYSQGQTFVWESIGEGAFHSESDFNKITFDFQGNVQFPTYSDILPTLAFTDDRNRYLSCVQVKTLLGAMSIEQNELCIP